MAVLLVLIALFGVAVRATPIPQSATRIISGTNAGTNVVWQAGFQAITTEGTQNIVTLCGGAFIGNGQYVLTAGHCVKKIESGALKNPSSISITAGRNLNTGKTYAVQRYWVNPAYDSSYAASAEIDLAVLQLVTPLNSPTDGSTIQLCSTTAACETTGNTYLVTGYGDQQCSGSTCGTTATVLQQTTVTYVSRSQCATTWQRNFGWPLMTTAVCAVGSPNNQASGNPGTCFGDSGGPLAYNSPSGWLLVGAVSTSTQPQGQFPSCGAPGEIGVYVSVPLNYNWIMGVMSGNTTTPSVDAACVASNSCQTSPPCVSNCGTGGGTTTIGGIPWYYYVPAIIVGALILLMLLICCIRACANSSHHQSRHQVARNVVVVQPPPPKPATTTTTYTVQMQPAPPPPVAAAPQYQPQYQPQMYTPQYQPYNAPAPSAPAYNANQNPQSQYGAY